VHYFTSTRPGGVNGANAGNLAEIWVSQRTILDAPWGTPVNLDAFNSVAVVNSTGNNTADPNFSNTADPNFSPDGNLLFFDTSLTPG
jgi:hypothetical protein